MSRIFPLTLGYGNSIFNDVDSLFNQFLDVSPASYMKNRRPVRDSLYTETVPRANILKEDKGYVLELAVPGFSRNDFNISVDDNVLTVSANSDVTEDYTNSLATQEYSYSSFNRSWSLPVNTYMKGIDASYEAGILSVSIPVEDISEKTIEIEVK